MSSIPMYLLFNQLGSQAQTEFKMEKSKTAQKNGTATSGKVPNVKATTAKPASKSGSSVKPSLEERIQKADELKSLTMKRARTIQTLHHIRTFSFASDDNCTLTIEDSDRQSFETSNSNLIGMLKDYLIKVLSDKVSELDDEILAFSI